VQAVTKGINAMATTKVAVAPVESMLKYDRTFTGSGTDTDVVSRPNTCSLPQLRGKALKRRFRLVHEGRQRNVHHRVDTDTFGLPVLKKERCTKCEVEAVSRASGSPFSAVTYQCDVPVVVLGALGSLSSATD